jgi:hypothetical protein
MRASLIRWPYRRLAETPEFVPHGPLVAALECNDAVLREADRACLIVDKQRQQPWQMWKMPGNQDVASFTDQAITHPRRRVVGLQIGRGREFRKRIARAPECQRRLPGAKLAAMPDDGRFGAPSGGLLGQPRRVGFAARRKRPSSIDLRTNGVSVVDQEKLHEV